MHRVLAFSLISTVAAAQTPQLVYHTESAERVRLRPDVGYSTAAPQLVFDLYSPPEPAVGPRPVVIFFNGVGSAEFRRWPGSVAWAREVAAAGLAAITYEARVDHAAEDYQALMSHLRSNAPALGVDPDRVGIWMGSTNARVGLPIAEAPGETAVRAIVVYYGVAPVTTFRLDRPLFIVRAGLDAPQMNRALDSLVFRAMQQNAPVTVSNHSIGHHPFEQSDSNALSRRLIEETIGFLRRSLLDHPDADLSREATVIEAQAALYAADAPRALRLYREATQAAPERSDLQQRLADAALLAGDFAAAAQAYEGARRLGNPNRGLIALGAILAYGQLGDRAAVIRWIGEIPPIWPKRDILARPEFAPIRARPDMAALFQ